MCLKTDGNSDAGNYKELKYNIRVKHGEWDLNVCLKTDGNSAAGNYREVKYNIRVKHRGWDFKIS